MPNKSAVAVFCNDFLPYSETFIYDELRHHRRYAATVFTPRRLSAAQFPPPCPVHSLAPGSRVAETLYRLSALSPSFMRVLRNGAFALLHAHFATNSIYAWRYQRRLDLPLIVTCHGHEVPLLLTGRRLQPRHWPYWLLFRHAAACVDRFLAASIELADLLVRAGVPSAKIRVWRLGVEIPPAPAPRSSRGPLQLLMIGRCVEKKGMEYGLEAVAEALAQGQRVSLRLIGDGPRRPLYERLVRDRGIGSWVHFVGALPHAEALRELLNADVLLAPSVVARNGDRESGLLVVKEAAARSVPAIGTLHGGIPEIIEDGRTGFLVPERSVRDLAERIVLLGRDEALRLRLGQAARRKMVREYDIVDRLDVLEQHYDEVREAFAAARPGRGRATPAAERPEGRNNG